METIEIVPPSESIYRRYSGQTQPQACFVELDCESGKLTARYNPEIGNAVPAHVWHGHTQRWPIPALRLEAAAKLLLDIGPLASRVVAGYLSEWDGSNHVAAFSNAAQDAMGEILSLCERVDAEDAERVWDARDWLESGGRAEALSGLAEIGLSAATTDEELSKLADRLEDDAREEGVDQLENTEGYLIAVRAEMKSDAAEE